MITTLSEDEALELKIEQVRELLINGPTREARRLAACLMTELVRSRSEQRVRQMAVERGLPTA